jgi:peptide/nickel transport system substrate-binding protein
MTRHPNDQDLRPMPSFPGPLAAAVLSRRRLLARATALGLGGVAAVELGRTLPAAAAPGTTGALLAPAAATASTLTIGADGSPSDLDPHSAYDYRSVLAILGAYEPLIGLKGSATDQYEGIIAETWEPNADKSVWTFHIRDGVTFQDGSPCDAEAVRASFERLLTMKLGPYLVIGRFVSDPAKITAPDAKTVVFNLGKPQPLFEAAMASTYGPPIVNAKAMKEQESDGDWGHTWAQINAVGTGTGPYKIVSFEPDQQLVMEKYDGYWKGWEGNHFDQVVIRVVTEEGTRRQLLEQGKVDLVDDLTPEDIDALAKNPALTIHSDYSTQTSYFIMNEYGPLKTPEARQAMCFAFPYDEVINGIFKGHAKQAVGIVTETIRGFAPETFKYTTDLDQAKTLLAKAGVASGTKLKIMVETGVESAKSAAQLFQANLTKLGLTLDVQEIDTASYTALLYGDSPPEEHPDFIWWGWWPDYNDAWDHLWPQISCDAWGSKGSNAGSYCNKKVDQLLAQAKDAADPKVYQKALAEAQQILSKDDPPAIYYAQPEWTTVVAANLTGFIFNPINIGTYNFWNMGRKA